MSYHMQEWYEFVPYVYIHMGKHMVQTLPYTIFSIYHMSLFDSHVVKKMEQNQETICIIFNYVVIWYKKATYS